MSVTCASMALPPAASIARSFHFPLDGLSVAIYHLVMLNDIANGNLSSLDIATLRAWHRDASDSAAVCSLGTPTHAVRVAWLSKIAAELRTRGC